MPKPIQSPKPLHSLLNLLHFRRIYEDERLLFLLIFVVFVLFGVRGWNDKLVYLKHEAHLATEDSSQIMLCLLGCVQDFIISINHGHYVTD